MSNGRDLQNSYGPEVTPYQASAQPPPEYHDPPQGQKPDVGAPEVVAPTGPKPEHKKMLGLRVFVFWTLVALALLVALGVGVGVGVGVGAKHGSSSSPASSETPPSDGQGSMTTSATSHSETSSTATSTSTSSAATAVATSGTHGLAANSCTSTTPKTYHGADGTSFTEYCFTDWPNNSEAADGRGNVTDISRTTVYTFEACMEACVTYNKKVGDSGTQCRAITYNSNLTSIIEIGRQGGNCFLKNKKGVDLQGSAESACAAIAL